MLAQCPVCPKADKAGVTRPWASWKRRTFWAWAGASVASPVKSAMMMIRRSLQRHRNDFDGSQFSRGADFSRQ